MAEQIKLQQALFGYRDGHNLLATSTVLAPRVRQFLATITDSSGPESIKGFEGAFTGLPIPETNFYALFRTWPAPEMPRPGCVWSHVILIQLADLARIPALFQLGKLCSRPSVPIDSVRYEESLALDITKAEVNSACQSDQRKLHCLIRALYEHPGAGVVILDEESTSWEGAVFQVWAQQWPRLRREFTFSTGSLGDRRLTGIPFDLQIAPISSERIWRRAELSTLLLNFLTLPPKSFLAEPIPQWVDIAEDDLCYESKRRFRQFLFDYGSDVEKPRAAFAKLAATYNHLGTFPKFPWMDLLRSVGESFPGPTEAVRLKESLITLPENANSSDKLGKLVSIIYFFLDCPQSTAYPYPYLDFTSLTSLLWKEHRAHTIELLSRLRKESESLFAISCFKELAGAVDSFLLSVIANIHWELVSPIIEHNPTLAYEINTWKLSSQIQSQVYNTLAELPLNEAEWGKIVGAMCSAGTSVSAYDAAYRADRYALKGIFRFLEEQNYALPNDTWRKALSSVCAKVLSKDQNLPTGQLVLATWCALPEDVLRALSVERQDVKHLAIERKENLPACLRMHSAFVLLSLGLCAPGDTGKHFVLSNFYCVHDALASGRYQWESWLLLSHGIPQLGFWQDWDKCKRLRKAVNKYLKKHGGSKQLQDFASKPEEREVAIEVFESDIEDSDSEFID